MSDIRRLIRAAVNLAGAEIDAPNYDAFAVELQDAVKPFEHLVTPPKAGEVVQYFNPSYAPDDNEGAGVGPYSATVLMAWDYYDSLLCNLAVVTPGKDGLAHLKSVPQRGSASDDGKYPCWDWGPLAGNAGRHSSAMEDRMTKPGQHELSQKCIQTWDIAERLLATRDYTAMLPVTHGSLYNPDGPEAADVIGQLAEALQDALDCLIQHDVVEKWPYEQEVVDKGGTILAKIGGDK